MTGKYYGGTISLNNAYQEYEGWWHCSAYMTSKNLSVNYSNKLKSISFNPYNGYVYAASEDGTSESGWDIVNYKLYGILADGTAERLSHYTFTNEDRARYANGYRLDISFSGATSGYAYNTWNSFWPGGSQSYLEVTTEEQTTIPIEYDGQSEIEFTSFDGTIATSMTYNGNPIY